MKLFFIFSIFTLIFVNTCLCENDAVASGKIISNSSPKYPLQQAAGLVDPQTKVKSGLRPTNFKAASSGETNYKPSTRTDLSGSEITAVLDRLNYNRKAIGAIRMEVLSWNSDFADAMHAKDARCQTEDPIPPYPTHPNYNYIWTSVIRTYTANVDVTPAVLQSLVDAFFSWSIYYYYDTNSCMAGYEDYCLAYRVVTQSTATQVGCSYQECGAVDNATVTGEVVFLSCLFNYDASVDFWGDRPYTADSQSNSSSIVVFLLAVLTASSFISGKF